MVDDVEVVAALGAESMVTADEEEELDEAGVVDDVSACLVLVSSGSTLVGDAELVVVVVVDEDDGFISSEEVEETEDTSFSVDVGATELVVEGVSVSSAELGVTVTCFVEEGTVTVTMPALPPVAERVSPDVVAAEEVASTSSPLEVAEGVTVTRVVDEGTVTVTTPLPLLTFPPVADLVSLLVEPVCSLEVSLEVGVTVTCVVEEGTVTVTAFPASVSEAASELAESLSDEIWLAGVEDASVVDTVNPVTLNEPLLVVPDTIVLFACELLAALVGPF